MTNETSRREEDGTVLSSERLEYTPFRAQDVPFLHSLWTDPDVRRYLWDDRIIAVHEAATVVADSCRSFEEHSFGMWLLRLKPGLLPVGFCGLRHFGDPPQQVEVLYALLPSHWHLGLATEAASTVLHFAFHSAGLRRVFAGTDPPNVASQRVITRLGMTYHGSRTINGLEAVYFAIDSLVFGASLAPESVGT